MLELLPTDAGGMLKPRSLQAFGGPYSLYVRLWRGGVGSPRMIYRSGIAAFDNLLRRDVAGEVAFLTMEELTEGILFRLNVNQRIACVGLRKSDIDYVDMLAFRVRVRVRHRWRTVHRGELTLSLRNGNKVTLQVIVREFRAIQRYFAKSGLRDKFRTQVSEVPDEDDGGELPEVLRTLFD